MSDLSLFPPPASSSASADGHRSDLSEPLVRARRLTRWWGTGNARQVGIVDVDLDLPSGELIALVGPSGSGKSTLGSLLAGIDTPSSGTLQVGDTHVDRLQRDRLAEWRGRNVGIVFQDFHLLPTLTAQENVELALRLGRRGADRPGGAERRRLAQTALERVGLTEHARRLPAQMSGGEQQRVAVARALVTDPSLVIADEPTGSLDQRNGHVVFDLLRSVAAAGTTVVMITHDVGLAAAADRVVHLLDGRIDAIELSGAVR